MLEIRRRARHAVGPLMGAAVAAYFVFHAVQGDRGLIAWWHLRQEIAKAQSEQQEVAAIRADLEQRVSLLRPDSLDPDMLEERARQMLGYGRKGEQVILLPDE